jgi:hypothetical protein
VKRRELFSKVYGKSCNEAFQGGGEKNEKEDPKKKQNRWKREKKHPFEKDKSSNESYY